MERDHNVSPRSLSQAHMKSQGQKRRLNGFVVWFQAEKDADGDSNEPADTAQNHPATKDSLSCNRLSLYGGQRARSLSGHRGAEVTRRREHGQVRRLRQRVTVELDQMHN